MLQRDGGCGAAVQMNRAVRPILLCGRICAGKTTYAKRLGKTRGAVCLSCDELMLALFGQQLGGTGMMKMVAAERPHICFPSRLNCFRPA